MLESFRNCDHPWPTLMASYRSWLPMSQKWQPKRLPRLSECHIVQPLEHRVLGLGC